MQHKALASLAVAALIAALAAVAAPRASAAGGGSGCLAFQNGQWVTVSCQNAGGSPGSPGDPGTSASGHSKVTCTLVPVSKAELASLHLPRPPKGFRWEAVSCPGQTHGLLGWMTLVNTRTGRPAITPQQLLQQALSKMIIPALRPATAPPRGKDGLVGLPEWFWVPRPAWRPVSVTVTAGPVWATATARPYQLTFSPGGGLAGVSCAGPGTPYNPGQPAAAQHSACTYTYDQSSAGQPGSAYRAALTVTWRVSWTGSDGAGGVLNPALQIPSFFALPVAEAQALNPGS
jgi:hypothetical protein